MEWEDVGKAEEEDAFLVEWKAEVRRMSDEIHNHPSECVQLNLRRHCLPQMCALLQPLRDNMVQCSSFVQVSPPPTSSTWQRRQRQSGSSHHRFITNCHSCVDFKHFITRILRSVCTHQPSLLTLILHLSRLQDVSDIADIVLARSRTAFSVRIHPFSFLTSTPTRQPTFVSSTQQHLPAGEREAILSKI